MGQGDGGKGDGGRGGGGKEILGGGGYTKICCILLIFLYFYVLQCNNWISEVPNRGIDVNSGIFTMNPALISVTNTTVSANEGIPLISVGVCQKSFSA